MSIMFGLHRIQYFSRKSSRHRHTHNTTHTWHAKNSKPFWKSDTLLCGFELVVFGLGRILKWMYDWIESKSNAQTVLRRWWSSVWHWMGSVGRVVAQYLRKICLPFVGIHTIILGGAKWISDWGLWIQGFNFTATMHQLFPVRDAETVLLFSKLIVRRVY